LRLAGGASITAGAINTGALTLGGTLADINASLATLSYRGLPDFNGSDSLQIVTSDLGASGAGGVLLDADVVALNVGAVNDAPVVAPVTLAPVFAGAVPHLITQADLLAGASDVDGDALTAGSLALSGGAGTLADNGNGTWTYTPLAGDDSGAAFTYQVSDGVSAVAASATLDLLPVNSTPVIVSDGAGAAATLSVAENAVAVTVVKALDADVPAQVLTYAIAGGADAARFAIDAASGALTFVTAPDFESPADADGDNRYEVLVRASDGALDDTQALTVVISNVNERASISGANTGVVFEDGAPLAGALSVTDPDAGEARFVAQIATAGAHGVFSLDASGLWLYSLDNAQAAVQQLAAGDMLTETFTAVSVDGSASTAIVVTIAGANDAPRVLANTGATVDEGGDVTLSTAMLDAASIDSAAGVLTYTLVAAPADGVLTLNGAVLAAGGAFTQNDIDAGRVAYHHGGGENSADGLTLALADARGISGGVAPLQFRVNPVNDAPVSVDAVVRGNDSGAIVLTAAQFAFSDVDGGAFAGIRVASLPASGSLLLNGAAVVVNQDISAADIAAGRLQYAAAANLSAPTTVGFDFRVSDGAALSVVPNRLQMDITPVLSGAAQPDALAQSQTQAPAQGQTQTATAAPASSDRSQGRNPLLTEEAADTTTSRRQLASQTVEDNAPRLVQAADAATRGAAPAAGAAVEGSARRAQTAGSFLSGLALASDAAAAGVTSGITANAPGAVAQTEFSARVAAATANTSFLRELDRARDSQAEEVRQERVVIESSVAAGATVTVGYVLWLLRGSLLLTTALSSLPAWRFVDPLPVLGNLSDGEDEDGETLESIASGEGGSGAERGGRA
jgi:VCBS repeat-containing protein